MSTTVEPAADGLLALAAALSAAREIDEVLAGALDALPGLLGYEAGEAWLGDRRRGGFRLAGRRGPAGGAAGGPELRADVVERLRRGGAEPFTVDGSGDVLVAPLRWDPEGRGALVVAVPPSGPEPTERVMRLAGGLAGVTSLALGNAARVADLERASLSTVRALAGALAAKDHYTGEHGQAVAGLAGTVGGELGRSGEDLRRLELGALFHDIGKIGVPSEILRKPGPLTAAERSTMNLHPEIGERILAPVPFLQPVRPIVRASHERWDGAGYPDRLGREDIPLDARIVFVCDAYHAMTSDRSYRAALPVREALRRLRAASGSQFDPAVVDAFLRLHAAGRIGGPHRS